MLTKDFINIDLPLLSEQTTSQEALSLMDELELKQIPAQINGSYGFFSYENLRIVPTDTLLGKVAQLMIKAKARHNDHIWESLRQLNHHHSQALPVVDTENKYCGTILLKDISSRITEVFPIANGGAIIQVEMHYRHYSLHELAGIVEGANAKITLLSVVPIEDTEHVNVAFSIDKNDATEIIQTLERHNYHVHAWFMNKGVIDNILDERYNAFMTYINV